nr:hypothetical protein Iba_chr04dCG18510 [Ipomoea batatas]
MQTATRIVGRDQMKAGLRGTGTLCALPPWQLLRNSQIPKRNQQMHQQGCWDRSQWRTQSEDQWRLLQKVLLPSKVLPFFAAHKEDKRASKQCFQCIQW